MFTEEGCDVLKPDIVIKSGKDQSLLVFRTRYPCCDKVHVVFAMPTGDFELVLDEAIQVASGLLDAFRKWKAESSGGSVSDAI